MCFSAMVWADYRKYVRQYGARIDIHEFIRLFELRAAGEKLAIPRAVSNAFMQEAGTDEERYCQELIDQFEAAEVGRIQADLFQQRHRLADAERALLAKTTKKASEDKRIAGNKVAAAVAKLKELQQPHSVIEETRIFSGAYCPVMVMNDAGEYVVRPMRYLCRPPGMPPESDRKYPGMYNARRSSLGGVWKPLYGRHHAVLVASAFFENVHRHRVEGRQLAAGEQEENVVLRFAPDSRDLMQIACLWSHWRGAGQPDLLSFAAITEEAPPEVADVGHDRCIIPLRDEQLPQWLAPAPKSLGKFDALLDDRARPYYEHLLAA